MAVIITFLSNYRESNLKKYTLPVEGEITGYYTNDAPLIYLSRKIEEELPEEKNIKVVTITSYQVFTGKFFSDTFEVSRNDSDKCRTMYDYYENALVEKKELYKQPFFWKEKKDVNVKMCMIPYGFYFDEQGSPREYEGDSGEKTLNSVYAELAEFLKDEKYIYIDYSGGLRNVQYLMASLIQFFELSDMQCKQIVYCMLNPSEVVDIKNIYNIGQIVQAVSDFTETGSVKKLGEIFGNSEKYGYISALVAGLDRFVKAISIGRVDELDDIRKDIKDSLDNLDKSEKTDSLNDLYSGIFMTLVPKIKESFYMKDKESSLSYANIIKWCLEHRFIQQAATVYVEKMPSIYIARGVNNEEFGLTIEKKALGSSMDSTLFFYSFWSRLFPNEISMFAQKLADGAKIKNEKNILDYLLDLSESDKVTPREKKALDLFIDYIGKYTASGNFRFGTKEKAENKDERLSFMLNKSNTTAYCLMNKCHSAPEYIRIADMRRNDKRRDDNSYKAQKATLKKFDEFIKRGCGAEYEKLYEIMKYYLAVKIIRNNMNHASLMSSEDMDFVNMLADDKSGVISYDKAYLIISAGVSLTDDSDANQIITKEMWDRLTECTAV